MFNLKLFGTVLFATAMLAGLLLAQDSPAQKAAGKSVAAPTPTPEPPARKSFKLPEGPGSLAEKVQELDTASAQAEQTLLRYIGNSAIYDSQDSNARLAAFNQQDALFQKLRLAQQVYSEWIRTQRKEFDCATCYPVKDPGTGKWKFEEQPVPQGGK